MFSTKHKENKHVEKTLRSQCVSSASQTAQQLDRAADAMSMPESEDDAKAEQEAASSTQSTEIENDEEQTVDNKSRPIV